MPRARVKVPYGPALVSILYKGKELNGCGGKNVNIHTMATKLMMKHGDLHHFLRRTGTIVTKGFVTDKDLKPFIEARDEKLAREGGVVSLANKVMSSKWGSGLKLIDKPNKDP